MSASGPSRRSGAARAAAERPRAKGRSGARPQARHGDRTRRPERARGHGRAHAATGTRRAPRDAEVGAPATGTARAALATYLGESRDVGLSIVLVLPLLLGYEIAVLVLRPTARNGAELAVARLLSRLDPASLELMRRGSVLVLLAIAATWAWRHPPAVARTRWILLEALGFALLLGPLVGWLVGGFGLSLSEGAPGGGQPAWQPFLLSVGAGVWEELVFRLGLLGGLSLLLVKLVGVPRPAAIAAALVASSLAFALYHHLGEAGEPVTAARFAFRAVAGTILGLLFASRGLAVVVYMHVFYDVLCDLRALHG